MIVAAACSHTTTRVGAPQACSWQAAPSADPHASLVDRFDSVAVVSATEAWAVGNYFTGREGGPHGSFIERWDGSRWHVAAAPVPKGASLWSVSAAGRNNVWAVGARERGGQLIEHWDGRSWRQVAPPPVRGGIANAVVARAASDAWVVGLRKHEHRIVTMTEHWDGTKWSDLPSPSPPPAGGRRSYAILQAVTVVSPSDLWAVGSSGSLGSDVTRTLIEHWNGRGWTIVPSPNVRSPGGVVNNILFSISGTRAHDIWAVGSWGSSREGYGGKGDHALTLHWDGRRWSHIATPALDRRSLLSGVAPRGRLAWAVGDQGLRRPLILRWDGARWSRVPAPPGFAFVAVAVEPGRGTLWAVGEQGRRPLAARCVAAQLG